MRKAEIYLYDRLAGNVTGIFFAERYAVSSEFFNLRTHSPSEIVRRFPLT